MNVDIGRRTVSIQAGALWKEVYFALKGTGYLVVGGLCPTVSVSGFTLGGGFNWFLSRFYGIAAENTIAMKVVLASGELVTVTWDNEYSDLAWGLLGSGGQQLGMVVEFTMRLHPEDTYTQMFVSYSFTEEGTAPSYPMEQFKKVFIKLVETVYKLKDKPEFGGVSVTADRDLSMGHTIRRYSMGAFGICRGCDWDS